MKILVVGIRWPAETFLCRLFEGLHESGHEMTIAHKDKPKRNDGYCPEWIHPFFLKFTSLKKWHILYFPWNSSAIENLNFFDHGVPCVVSCRGSQVNVAPHNPNRQALKQGLVKTFQSAAAVHCVSEAMKREAMRYGLEARNAHVIRPGVDADFFIPKKREENKTFNIVSAGNLVWHKGYEYALQAVAGLKEKGIPVKYKILGDGQERQRVLYTIHDLNLQQEVTLLGKLSSEQVRETLQSADAFLLSSVTEGISNAVLEAMACGLPVITADCGGMREAVKDGQNGVVVPVRDAKTMTLHLEKLAKSQDLRRSLGAAGRETIMKEFSLKNQILQMEQLFRTAAK